MNYYCESCGTFTGDDGQDQNIINGPRMIEGRCDSCQDMEDVKAQKAKFDSYLEIHDELILHCEEWIDAFGTTNDSLHDISVRVFNEAYPPYIIADYAYYQYGRCDDNERVGEEKIPLSIFWDNECVSKERKKRQEKQLVALKKNEEKKKVRDMKDKALRYEKWLELNEEFDDQQ